MSKAKPQNTDRGRMDTADKIKLARIVGVLLIADGELTDQEVAHLETLFTNLGLDADQRHEVIDRIASGTEVMQDVRSLRAHGKELFAALQQAALADGVLVGAEEDMLAMIAEVLDQDDQGRTS